MKLFDRVKQVISNKDKYQIVDDRDVKELNDTFYRCFNTTDGKYVLDYLIKKEILPPKATQGDNMLDIGVKQGRANLVLEILQRLDFAKKR